MEIWRERNQATTIYFPMIKVGGNDFAQSADWTPVAADCQYSEDGAAFSNTGSLVTNEGGGAWSLAVAASELDGKVTVIKIEDAATKAVEDQMIVIQTWGDDSAGIPFNAIADYVLRRGFQAMIDSSRGDSKSFRSLAGAVAKLVNRIYRSGSNLLITEDDDTTTLGTQAMTTSAAAEQITDLDTT
jgi:hypothetical protein